MGLNMNDNRTKIVELDLNDVLPNRFQPRIVFNEDSIIDLSESIKEHGVLQAIIVRPIGDKYEIIAGERRYKASVLAGLKTIPSIILDLNDKDSAEIALIENVQRRDLTPIEEALSIKKILDMGYITQEQLAAKLGRSQSSIANKIRLLNLCDEVQEALMEGKISERHARSLLKISSKSAQQDMLKKIIKERLTVRKLDAEIEKFLEAGSIDISDKELDEIDNKKLNDDVKLETEKINSVEDSNSNIKENTNTINEDLNSETQIIDEKLENNSTESLNDVNNTNESDLNKEINPNIDSSTLSEEKTTEIIFDEKEQDLSKKIDIKKEEDLSDSLDYINNTDESDLNKEIDSNINSTSLSEETPDEIVLDLSDLFIDLDDNEKKIIDNEEENDVKKGENDMNNNLNNNNNFFNMGTDTNNQMQDNTSLQQPLFKFNNDETDSSEDFMKEKMKDLMAPQGSSPSFQTPNSFAQNSIFLNNEVPTPQKDNTVFESQSSDTNTSMFSNLMNNETNVSNETIDSNSLNQFLDPKFIDGSIKEETPSQANNLDTSVFAKFLDPSYSDSSSENSEQTSTFSQDSNNSSSDAINIFNKPFQFNQPVNNTVEPIINNQSDILEPAPSIENINSVSNDSAATNVSTHANEPNTNVFNSISNPEISQTEQQPADDVKPDLLAPMTNQPSISSSVERNKIPFPSINELFSNINHNKESNTEEINSVSNNISDSSITTENNTQNSNSFENIERATQPVFVTSSETNDSLMPVTPIIDNPEESKLLTPSTNEVGPTLPPTNTNEVENSIPSETEKIMNNEESYNSNSLNVQPIIVTDYNKQYDPVLPTENISSGPQVEFKQILSMIRNLNDRIESLGYTIDTDEIDLDDKYQVIFNIMKK